MAETSQQDRAQNAELRARLRDRQRSRRQLKWLVVGLALSLFVLYVVLTVLACLQPFWFHPNEALIRWIVPSSTAAVFGLLARVVSYYFPRSDPRRRDQ